MRSLRGGVSVGCDFTVFGDKGRHARAAVGAPSLPLDAAVEVEGLFEIA